MKKRERDVEERRWKEREREGERDVEERRWKERGCVYQAKKERMVIKSKGLG